MLRVLRVLRVLRRASKLPHLPQDGRTMRRIDDDDRPTVFEFLFIFYFLSLFCVGWLRD